MKALVFEEPRRAVIQDLEMPQIAADEVLVRSRNVGICHSDFELYEGRYIIPVSYPIVPGHEWSGEVAEVGAAVTNLRPGDRVVGECVVNNGDDHFGFSIGGADAEYFVAKASWLHRIPEELSFAHGAFVEPFSVAYNATVAAGGIDASDSVAVVGGGPIGLLCTLAAATMGGTVTLVEPQAHRRALGLEIGAREALEPGEVEGRRFDVIIEAAGVPAAMSRASTVTRSRPETRTSPSRSTRARRRCDAAGRSPMCSRNSVPRRARRSAAPAPTVSSADAARARTPNSSRSSASASLRAPATCTNGCAPRVRSCT